MVGVDDTNNASKQAEKIIANRIAFQMMREFVSVPQSQDVGFYRVFFMFQLRFTLVQ